MKVWLINATGIGAIVCWLVALVAYCTPSGTPNPQVIKPGVDFATCVLEHAIDDAIHHLTPPAAVAEIIASCGGDAAAVAVILDENKKALEFRLDGGTMAESFGSYASSARLAHPPDGG